MIPPILHQTWKTECVPGRFREAVARWRQLHPHWAQMFWNGAAIEVFVDEPYPRTLPLFRAYPDQTQRVDAVRYMILDYLCHRRVVNFINRHLYRQAPIGTRQQIDHFKGRVDTVVASGKLWLTILHVGYPFHSRGDHDYRDAHAVAGFRK